MSRKRIRHIPDATHLGYTSRKRSDSHHNQCLALQTVAILMKLAKDRCDSRGMWIYEHAARHVIPAMYEGEDEPVMPRSVPAYLPKVMIADDVETDDAATLVNTLRRRRVTTLSGVGQ
jgi:hypothetical protein